MKATGKTVMEILTSLPLDRVEPFNKLHDVIVKNLPKGFESVRVCAQSFDTSTWTA